jgi:hypothetical protein
MIDEALLLLGPQQMFVDHCTHGEEAADMRPDRWSHRA